MPQTSNLLSKKRCSNCNTLLCEAAIIDGTVRIKCKCGTMNVIQSNIKKRVDAATKDRQNLAAKRTPA